ncbi:cysteine dioxygenase [Pyxidicoccus fallax]|uniref:Cysteine dioxygenase n=1 Tax=Pyxidicoccus fallax TaxID=394095 RepID=A0A848LZ00_9BACT|nr:cysteine dioxygenase family protein [Pyxidicoccus fallax]NMO23428.1 cysteine dioxygenase [Pyxidicoccus fallax]NPC86555.1 cysteine dioxygenase [Pyxidicoccus fallax]
MREHVGDERDEGCPEVSELLGWSLPERADALPSLEWLVERLRSSRVDWGLLQSLIRFNPEGYARRVLGRTDACELLLLCWLPGQVSRVHDHGGSSGVSWVVRGKLAETRFAWGGDRLVPASRAGAEEGDVLLERPETIHRLHNASRHGAVSLHVYAPPMVGMTRYDTSVAAELEGWPPRGAVLRPPRPPVGEAGRRRRPRAT